MGSNPSFIDRLRKSLTREVSSPEVDQKFLTGMISVFWALTVTISLVLIYSAATHPSRYGTSWKSLTYVRMGGLSLLMTVLLGFKLAFDRFAPLERIGWKQRWRIGLRRPAADAGEGDGMAEDLCRAVAKQNRLVMIGVLLGLVVAVGTLLLDRKYRHLVAAEDAAMAEGFQSLYFGLPATRPTPSPSTPPASPSPSPSPKVREKKKAGPLRAGLNISDPVDFALADYFGLRTVYFGLRTVYFGLRTTAGTSPMSQVPGAAEAHAST